MELGVSRDYFSKAVSIEPKDESDLEEHISSLKWLATCQKRLGEIDGAISTYKKILEFDPEDKLAKESLDKLLKERRLR